MKKFLPIVLLFLFGSGISYGQLGIGLRGGYAGSLSSQELVNGMDYSIGFRPTYGLSIHYDIDLQFAVGLEANYIGYEEILTYSKDFYPNIPNDPPKEVTTKSQVNYLQIPLLGRTTFGLKKFKWFLSFGPYVGIGMSGKRVNAMGSLKRLNNSYDAKFKAGDFMSYDMGGQLGAGIQYALGEKGGSIFIEGRLQIGFFDFYNKPTDEQRDAYLGSNAQGYSYFPPGAAWRAASISAGYFYTFKLPKKSTSASAKKAGKQKRK